MTRRLATVEVLEERQVCTCDECVESQLPDLCPTCGNYVWGGLHRNGYRSCVMWEAL